jgi:primosomal protein N' (replication factor Y)
VPKKVKEIIKIYNGLRLSKKLINFINWVASYNLASKGMLLKMVLGVNKHFDNEVKKRDQTQYLGKEIDLRMEQKKAYEFILKCCQEDKHKVVVLDGVTGSGKTEVYLKVSQHVFEQNGQVLILLPEIVLTTQLVQRFEERLGFKPIVWHSNISTKMKKSYWQEVSTGEAKLVVGARSALFLPFKNLKMVIVDEEHDQSYKQEEGVTYNARDMAIVRAMLENIPMILASATPSIETVYNIKEGKYLEVNLNARYGEAIFPEIKIIDLNHTILGKGEWISPTLRKYLAECILKQEQALLFLNRRGYAAITFCGNCRAKVECPNCNFWMVEHKKKGILNCHYCGYSIPKIEKCLKCGSKDKILALGPGVERIEEEVKSFLPEARTLVFTSDTIGNQKQAEESIQAITEHKVDIVIGTQVTAKGLHFPKLNLVGIIEADRNLVGGDIRTLERTYQLLHQVAGRAGRTSKRGMVLIQTYEPNSIVLENLVHGDRKNFYQVELSDREAADMPPFSRLSMLSIQSINERACLEAVDKLSATLPEYENINIFGPSPAPIYLIKKKYRYRFIIKSAKNIDVQKVLKNWVEQANVPKTVKLKVDIDPYNFL